MWKTFKVIFYHFYQPHCSLFLPCLGCRLMLQISKSWILMHICMHTHSARPNITHYLSIHCAAPSSSLFVFLIPFLLVLKSWSGFFFLSKSLCT